VAYLSKKLDSKQVSDIERVSHYILSTTGNFKIPIQYFDTIMEYRNKFRTHWKIRINFQKDDKGKKWPITFDFYQKR
jgi:hypothetical protein